MATPTLRQFSDQKHALSAWQTTFRSMNFFRPIARYLSFKRAGVDDCAKACREKSSKITMSSTPYVLDIGCGIGSYALWFQGHYAIPVVGVDWSLVALKKAALLAPECFFVCADAAHLPFKQECMSACYSVDTLGHIVKPEQALDEIGRVAKPGAPLFLHAECGDYRNRWPDKELIRRLGRDLPADNDGHVSVLASAQWRALCVRRFILNRFFSPAGLTGWFTGYPEKYLPAFTAAQMIVPRSICKLFSWIRTMPVLGFVLRLKNATLNHIELFFGIEGGGSCFMECEKPDRSE